MKNILIINGHQRYTDIAEGKLTKIFIDVANDFCLKSTPLPFNLHFIRGAFCEYPKKTKRNNIVCLAYLDGHSQIEIASFLGLSKSLISIVIKSGD